MKEMPWYGDIAAGEAAYKKASATAHEMIGEREKETKNYIKKQTAWLDRVSMAQIDSLYASVDKSYSDISLNAKISEKYDSDILEIMQRIAESKSRENLNYVEGSLVASQKRAQDFLNELNDTYGEDKVKAALLAYDDEHAESLTNRFFTVIKDVQPSYRSYVMSIMQQIGSFPVQKQKQFWDCLLKAKETGRIPEADELVTSWIETLLSVPKRIVQIAK